jgi:hypothetical protein
MMQMAQDAIEQNQRRRFAHERGTPEEQQPTQTLVAVVEHNQQIQRANPGCAGADYTLVCENCKKLFQAPTKLSGQQRTSFEYECLRRVLLIADHTVLPVFCDACYEQAVTPPESRAMSYPNLVLEKLRVQPS